MTANPETHTTVTHAPGKSRGNDVRFDGTISRPWTVDDQIEHLTYETRELREELAYVKRSYQKLSDIVFWAITACVFAAILIGVYHVGK